MEMRKETKMMTFVSLFVAALIILNIGIVGFNNGAGSFDREYDCGGSCHIDPSVATVSMSASKLNPNPGETITVTVTVLGAEASSSPLGVFLVRSATLTNSMPSVDGWVILSDPSGTTTFNYYEEPSVTGGVVWTWTLQAPLAGGTYNLLAREHHGNPGGNDRFFSEDLVGLTFTITAADNPPSFYVTAPGSAPGEQYIQGTMIPIDWAASDDNPWPMGGDVVNLTYGATPTGGTPIMNNLPVGFGTYSWDTSIVPPGVYYINGSVFDSVSQVMEDSTNNSFEIILPDNAPSFYVTAPGSTPGEQYVQGSMVPITWAAADDNPWPAGGLVVNLTYGAMPMGGTPIANDLDVTGGYSWDTSLIPPGFYYINGSAWDSSGQDMFSNCNNSFEIVAPDNPPLFFITNPGSTPGEIYTQGTLVTISWAAMDDNPWPAGGLIVNLSFGATPAGGTPLVNDQDVSVSYSWDTAPVAPGIYYVNGSVYDSAGQTTFHSSNNSFEIILPDDPPTLFITNPGSTPGEQYVQGTTVPISWAAADDNPWPATGLIVNITYGPTPAGGTPIANNQDVVTIFSWDTTGVAPGFYYVNASVWDSRGQTVFANCNNSFEIVLPDTPPTLFVTNPGSTPGEIYGQGSIITISWAAWDESPWPFAGMIVNLTFGLTPAGGTPIANDQDVALGYSWDTAGVAVGFYYVNASVYDSSGNITFANCNNSFEITLPDTNPPMILNALAMPSPQELGLPTNISAIITDDTTLNPATVFVNVTYPSLTTSNISMSRSIDLYWVDQPFMEIGMYTFIIWAADTSGNWASDVGAFEVIDTTPPAIVGTTAIPSPQLSGGFVNISTTITDLGGVATADVEVFDPLGVSLFNVSMLFDAFNGRYYWNTSYVPFGVYSFDIWASDSSLNWGMDTGNFEILGDITPPQITNVNAIPPVQLSGGNVNVSANVTDETALFDVWVELFDPGMVSFINTTMSYDIASGLFFYDSSYVAIGQWTFVISANDTSDNWASAQDNFDITDGTPPDIVNVWALPSPQEINGAVNVSAAVTDNVAVLDVNVEIIKPDLTPFGNFTMLYDAISGRYYYEDTYVDVGTHTFTIWAQDTNTNNNSALGSFIIEDTTPPVIDHLPVTRANLGVSIPISANVTDAGTIASVTLYFMNVGDTIYQSAAMILGVGNEYSASIPPQAQTGDVRYYIQADDSELNSAREPTVNYHTIAIIDSSPPIITNPVADPETVESGEETTISADVTDDSGVTEVDIFVDGPDDEGGAYQATYDTVTQLYEVTITPTVPGNYTYTVWAQDGSGNWGSRAGWFNVTAAAGKTPNPPDDVETLSVNGQAILVSWVEPSSYVDSTAIDPDDIRGYYVYRSDSATGQYERITNQPVRGELYLDRNVQMDQTYYYRTSTIMTDDAESAQSEIASGALEELKDQVSVDVLPWILAIVFLVLWIITLLAFILGKKGAKGPSEPPVTVMEPQVVEEPVEEQPVMEEAEMEAQVEEVPQEVEPLEEEEMLDEVDG
jgi:hypothetical protein